MKISTLIAIMMFLFSCTGKVPVSHPLPSLTENEKRKYFIDTFAFDRERSFWADKDSTRSFAYFFHKNYPGVKAKNVYDPLPYAFEEEYIDTLTIDTGRHWFRLYVYPFFDFPYCFILEKKYGKSYLTTKIADGMGRYFTGTLFFTLNNPYPDSLYDNTLKVLKQEDFWKLGRDSSCHGGLDGEEWTFEAIEGGKYHLISRWSPDGCGNTSTRNLAGIESRLSTLTNLKELMTTARRSLKNSDANPLIPRFK